MEIFTFKELIQEYDNLHISYSNMYGESHEFIISDIDYPSSNYGKSCVDAYSIIKDGSPDNMERTFKIERIDSAEGIDNVNEDEDEDEDVDELCSSVTTYSFERIISKYDTLFIGYTNREDEYHEFNISDISYPSSEYGSEYFDAYCIDKDGEPEDMERTFKIDRLDFIKRTNIDY